MNKKGAIEMSMQTIIVVIIGVTLLTLGIKFVVDTMGGVSVLSEGMVKKGDTQINEIFGESEELLSLMPDSFSLKRGNSEKGTIYVRNNGDGDDTFTLSVDVDSAPTDAAATAAKAWIKFINKPKLISEGNLFTSSILLDPPANTKTGTYMATITVKCKPDLCGTDGESKQIIVEITGD